ncbi:hypothetical protein V6O07_07115, partial [Arthrospira platensis SPKY2]
KFVAGGEDGDARTANDGDSSYAKRSEDTDLLGAQLVAGRKNSLARLNIFTNVAHVVTRVDGAVDLDGGWQRPFRPPPLFIRILNRDNRVCPGRKRRAGHDPGSLSGTNSHLCHQSSSDVGDNLQAA